MTDKPEKSPVQMIPAIVLPEPKPYYGLEPPIWAGMSNEQKADAQATYYESVTALKDIYARLLSPFVTVK